MVARALEASDQLEEKGIDAGVIEIHTIKPLDEDILVEAAKETGAVVTVEQHSILGGLGSAVAESLTGRYSVPIKMVGIPDTFAESGSYEELLDKYGLSIYDIVKSAKKVLKRKKNH